MSDEKLDLLFRQLKEENAQILPPAFLSTRLKAEAARLAIRRKRRRYLTFLVPVFSAALLLGVLMQRRNETGSWPTMASTNSPTLSHPQPGKSAETLQQLLSVSAKYITIPSSVALPSPTETTVVRIVLRKEKLRQLGFSVSDKNSSELTKADFVLGEDGLARAIRFVGSIDGISVLKTATGS